MRLLLGLAVFGAFALTPGCCCSGPLGPHFLRDEDAAVPDAPFVLVSPDAGRDAAGPSDASCVPPSPCSPSCRSRSCAVGEARTIETELGVVPGAVDDPLHPGYARALPSDPTLDAPLHLFTPSLCLALCDPDDPSACGTCARCSEQLSQTPLVAELGGVAVVFPPARPSSRQGLCRSRCTFDPAGPGGCPAGSTCDRVEGVCIEACTSDLECNARAGITYEGALLAVQETDLARVRTCDAVSGRCVPAGPVGGVLLGGLCASDVDCQQAAGVCVEGVCVPPDCVDGSCFARCDAATPCALGLACRAGVCGGVCDVDEQCGVGEACAPRLRFGLPEGGAMRCVPRCAPVDARGSAAGCAEGEACRARDAAVATCAPLDGFCDVDDPAISARSASCGGGQICDALLAGARSTSVADGHCVDPCTSDADCATLPSFVCVTSGPLTGLCREPCGASGSCYTGQVCDAALGYCVEATL